MEKNTHLPYLGEDQAFCQWEKLVKIKLERDQWRKRPSVQRIEQLIDQLPPFSVQKAYSQLLEDTVTIGRPQDLTDEEKGPLEILLKELIPWRKGPFNLFGIEIDAEWKAHLKWNRIVPFLDSLENKNVLDIGCNNGYYTFRMAGLNPRLVMGIDPTLPFYYQSMVIQHYAQIPHLHFELFEMDHVRYFKDYFHTIFYMGILYHHRNPIEHLQIIHQALKTGGQLILETIGIPGEESVCLVPEKTYTKMRNVWYVPTLSCLINLLKRTHFEEIKVISVTPTTVEEQRNTDWCPRPRESYVDFIDPDDSTKTIEGYPAPLRLCLSARKKKI